MSTVNKVILIGNLGQDVEIITFDSGAKKARLTIATSENYTNKEGEKIQKTTWHTVETFFEKQIEVLEKYLKKGDKVYIEGLLQNESWEDKDGNKKYRSYIKLREFTFLTPKGISSGTDKSEDKQTKKTTKKVTPVNNDDPDDDLPF